MGASSSISSSNSFHDELWAVLNEHKEKLFDIHGAVSTWEPPSSRDLMVTKLAGDARLFLLLASLLGQKRVMNCKPEVLHSLKGIQEPVQYNFSEYDEISNVEIESIDDVKQTIDVFIGSHKVNTKYSITAECQEAINLVEIDPFLANKNHILAVLNIASNQIDTDALDNSCLRISSLLQLELGGNSIGDVGACTRNIPASLLVLDLSFTEGLHFTEGCFLGCPQLLQLVVDGCGIKSTTFSDLKNEKEILKKGGAECDEENLALSSACSTSIFYGLVCLEVLSLKENCIENAVGLSGLAFFEFPLSHHSILYSPSIPEVSRDEDSSSSSSHSHIDGDCVTHTVVVPVVSKVPEGGYVQYS